MEHLKKARPDSKIQRLPKAARERIEEMLLEENATLKAVAEYATAAAGEHISISSVARYLHGPLAPIRRANVAALAAKLAPCNTKKITAAASVLVRQETLAMLAEAQGDPAALTAAARLAAENTRLDLEARRLDLEERKLALRESEAAKAEEAARRAADESMTPEERRAKIAALFGL